ncbi:MAG: tetratricopeptide repeat protein, partial [Ignavibacteriota bacterium]
MRFYQRLVLSGVIFAGSALIPSGKAVCQTSNDRIKKDLQRLELGNPKPALADLQKLVAESPKDPESHAALALAMIETGNLSGAAGQVDIAYDQERKNVLVRIARGVLFGKQGKREDAVEEFMKGIKINPNEISTLLYLARYYISVDSLKPAEVMLYRAQAVNANDVRPFLGLAELYEKQPIVDLAVQQYQEAKKIDPKDETVVAKLAQLYTRSKKYNDAVKEWDNVTKIDPDYARAYYEMAHIYDISDDPVNAAKYAEKYVMLDSEDLDGIWLLARSLAESNQYKKALPYLEKSAKSDSLKEQTDLYLARSYFFEKDFTRANQLYAASKNLSTYDLFYAGYSLVSIGDTSKGIETWKAALKSDTSGKADEKLKIRQQIISYLNIQKKYPEIAELYLETATAKKSADEYANAGQFYNFANLPDEAKKSFETALQINPKLIKAQVGLADVIAKSPARLAEAEQMLDGAALNAGSAEDKESVGNGYARLGI